MKKLLQNIFGESGLRNRKSLIQEEEENLKKTLPKDYAQRILDLEIQVELYNINYDQISELLNLYTAIIDFYICTENDKYNFFHNKMKELILKPKVIYIMNNKITNSDKNTDLEHKKDIPKIDQKLFNKQQAKIKELNMKVKNQNINEADDKYLNEIINIIDENVEKTKKVIKEDIKNQKNNLLKRLEKRKLNISQKKSFSRDIMSIKYNENSINENEEITEISNKNIILEED